MDPPIRKGIWPELPDGGCISGNSRFPGPEILAITFPDPAGERSVGIYTENDFNPGEDPKLRRHVRLAGWPCKVMEGLGAYSRCPITRFCQVLRILSL
jgi:hypothetical protein